MREASRWAVALLAAVCFCSVTLYGQSDTAQISGFAKDQSGAVIPGAKVTIRNEATGLERTTTATSTGYYVVSSVPPGYYTIAVEADGFKKFIKTGNKLDPSIATTIDAILEVGAVTETVEVVAQAAAIQSETATVGKLIESKQIEYAMLNGRNPLFLALTKPGVRGGSLAGFSFGLTSGGLSINGARTQDFVITFDGAVGIRTRANGTSVGTADMETVQEIQILTANYNAEYGRSSGGQVRFVTKSGSRDFHGSAYEYFRNNVLDANSWSLNKAGQDREARRFNQFGYIFSGPAYIPGVFNNDRNKLFFLWSQEWLKFRREETSIQLVPSLKMRQGDFSELLSTPNAFYSSVRKIKDPNTGQEFTNNVIPTVLLSQNGLGFLRSYPEPNARPGIDVASNRNFIQTRPRPENQRKDTISLDFIPSEKHTFRFRHQIYSYNALDAFRGGFDRAVTDWNRPNKNASLNHIWTISPTMVNEFLVTASVDRVYIGVQREGERFARSKYGINYPYIFPDRKEIFDKIPTVGISNFATVDGGPYPAFSSGPIYVVANTTSKIVGRHTFKFGALYERSGQNDFDQINVSGVPGGTNNQNGRFVFSDTRSGATTTGLGVANAAMGLFNTYAEIGQRAFTVYRANMFEFFGQDSWKATDKLRVELGLRYTLMTPYYYAMWGNMAVFDPNRYDPGKAVVQDPKTGFILSGDRYNGVLIPGKEWPDEARGRIAIADSGEFDRLLSGGNRYWGEKQKLNFQPRVGLAYQVTPRTVVRSGVGRFLARPGVSDNIFLGGNPPLQPMVSVANGQADNPSGGKPSFFPLFFMTSDSVFKIPDAWQWNASVEREIGFNTVLTLGYVGRVGTHLERERNLNQLFPGVLFAPENKGINVDVLRPYKGFANIAMGETAARSEYNAFQVELNRRFTRGFSYSFAYTYSKSYDNASGRRDRLWNNYDDSGYWGPSGFDTRHIGVINFAYEFPFFRDRTSLAGKMLGGWAVSGVTQFQTGTPFTVGGSDDQAGTGTGESQPWEKLGDVYLSRGERGFSESVSDDNYWFRVKDSSGNPLFKLADKGTFSKTQTRNTIYNVGFQNWNLALFKDFALRGEGEHKLQFRAEFYNWPNHPNWSGVQTNPKNSAFGKITSKGGERNIQLSLRYQF